MIRPDQNTAHTACDRARPSMLRRLRHSICRALNIEDGSATVEFVLSVPVIMMVFMASIESGVLMTRHIMLEHSVDSVMRNLRLGQYPIVNSDVLKAEICSRTAILNNCTDNIAIELSPINTSDWALPSESVGCVDRDQDIQPSLSLNPGGEHQIMLVRVCIVQNAMFPTTGIGLRLRRDEQGGYAMFATSAFVNEP